MAKDLQNIDNLFKDALSGYAEVQPSGSVWKGISGKLIWHNLVNLNFLNIPYFVPAAMIIVAGIIGGIMFISDPDPVKLNEDPAEEIAAKQFNASEPGAAAGGNDNPAEEIAETQFIVSVPKEVVVRNEDPAEEIAETQFIASEPKEVVVRNEDPAEEIAETQFIASVPKEVVVRNEDPAEEIAEKKFIASVPKEVVVRNEGPAEEIAEKQFIASEPGAVAGIEEAAAAVAVAGRNEEQPAGEVARAVAVAGSQEELVDSQQSPVASEKEAGSVSAAGRNEEGTAAGKEEKAYNTIYLSEKIKISSSTDEMLRPMSFIKFRELYRGPNQYSTLTLIPYNEITGARAGKKSLDYYSRNQYSVGIHFTPEKMYNSPDGHPDKNIYSVDMSLMYQSSKYIFQTGIGYSYFENDYNYSVNYQDFLGTYQALDSITFTYNPVTGIIPSYSWSDTDVYDTTDQTLTTGVTNYYSHIQIPVLIGYKLFEKKRVSIFIKGGPVVSFLVYKNEPGATYSASDKRVTSIDYTNPSRTKVNWQFQGSVGVQYQFVQRFSLAVEPTINYYFNNLYGRNKTSDTHPYLFGVKTGIIFSIK